METYRFVNIFETKGLEYMLLICFLVLFVLLVRYLTPTKPATSSRNSVGPGGSPR